MAYGRKKQRYIYRHDGNRVNQCACEQSDKKVCLKNIVVSCHIQQYNYKYPHSFGPHHPNPLTPCHVVLIQVDPSEKSKLPILPSPTHTNSRNHPPSPQYKIPQSFSPNSPPFTHFLSAITLLSNSQELAFTQSSLEDSRNIGVVTALYDALNRRDAVAIQQILAPDLEWWFHGPPSDQFLMRLLTGEQETDFRFVPHSVAAFGPTVLAEGFDQPRAVAWVHAWTVTDGIITQVREYLNTSLTVTRIGNTNKSDCTAIAALDYCPSVWESSLPDRVGKSVPGLVLAI